MTLSDFNWYSAEWRVLKEALLLKRTDLVERLVRADDAEVRGKIKQLDEILQLENEKPVTTGTTTY